jgi:hypothetical protein
LQNRRFEFAVERAVFLTVLHRLCAPGSDRAAEKWKADYTIEGAGGLDLQHLYRAMAWLGEVLPRMYAPPPKPSGRSPCHVIIADLQAGNQLKSRRPVGASVAVGAQRAQCTQRIPYLGIRKPLYYVSIGPPWMRTASGGAFPERAGWYEPEDRVARGVLFC